MQAAIIKTTFAVYLLLGKRHGVEASSCIFGRESTWPANRRTLFRAALYSSGIVVSFIMVHLIKAHARLYGCVSRESCASWPWNASKSRRERRQRRRLAKRAYWLSEIFAYAHTFAASFAESLYNQCMHACMSRAAASANEHSDILPLPVKLCARLRTMRIAMHACSFVTSRACIAY